MELLERATALADDVLAPVAEDVDRAERVPDSHMQALADAGLFGLLGPASHGGLDVEPHLARRVVATIAGGCGATFFVWVQHHGVVRSLRASDNADLVDRVLRPMCEGSMLAGTAFAHVRRQGPPAVRATRVDGGWQLDGHAPWATSWGMADLYSVAAVSDAGELVWATVPGAPAGVQASVLELSVFEATCTVSLTFDGCVVAAADVIAIEDVDEWRAADRRRAALAQPAALGVAERAVRGLRRLDAHAFAAADALDAEISALWQTDDDLVIAVAASEDRIDDASAHRAATLDLARRATGAYVAAAGGGGMARSHPAQRLAREALFYVIQAQTVDGRAAALRAASSSPNPDRPDGGRRRGPI